MFNGLINVILIIIVTVVIVVCSIGIIIAIKFQAKQKRKYEECINIIKENEDARFEIKSGLTKKEINKIDKNVDVDKLMQNLYSTYLEFEDKLKNLDNNFDGILTGYMKEFYVNKINNFKNNGYKDIKDQIELIGYSIIEFEKKKLKFRIHIICLDYKLVEDNIVSGSNLQKVEEVIILTYEKNRTRWFISNYEKIYQIKLGD